MAALSGRLPAAEIEAAVIDQVRGLLRAPEIIVGTWRASRPKVADGISEDQVRQALQDLDPLWDELFPTERARIVQLLVERIDVGTQGFDLRLRIDGLADYRDAISSSCTTRPSRRQHERVSHRSLPCGYPSPSANAAAASLPSLPMAATMAPPRPRIDNTLVKALARASQVEQAPSEQADTASAAELSRRREDQSVLRQPGAKAHLAGARHRRGDRRRAAVRRASKQPCCCGHLLRVGRCSERPCHDCFAPIAAVIVLSAALVSGRSKFSDPRSCRGCGTRARP